ncbi:MAG: hypothetical protein RL701_7929, partial [Pseudomonadota bacterium]
LLDFWLPDMTGHALLATRTRWPGALSLPVLLVTGDDAWIDEHRDLRQLGVVGLLRKPLVPSEFLRAVERALTPSPSSTQPASSSSALASLRSSRANGRHSERSRSALADTDTESARDDEPQTAAAGGAARQARRLADLLTRASGLLAQSLDITAQLRDIARLLVPIHADCCVFERSDATGHERQILCVQHEAAGSESELRALAELPDALGSAVAHVLETGQPRLFESFERPTMLELGCSDAAAERLLAVGFESVMIAPLVARRRVFGALTCASKLAHRKHTPVQLEALHDLAHRVALALDNSELLQLAQEATRAREELLASVSRDLRMPLSTIIATATKSLHDAKTPSENDAAGVILRNARIMEAQIRDLLDYAQLAAGHLRIELRKAQPAELLRQVVDALRQTAGKRHLELSVDADVHDLQLACDPERIKQAAHTLVEHALRVTPPEGRIEVQLSRVQGEVHVSLILSTTSGTAFADVDLIRLAACGQRAVNAERQRARTPTPDLRNGELQLCIARGLIEAHGGQVWFQTHESATGSRSTTHALHFSLLAEDSAQVLPPSNPGPVILLVDSDLAFRRELHEILAERGYKVETADNGWQAWNYLQSNPAPALILLDLMLPVMDGWELHAAIKSHPDLATVPTVIVSGLDRYRIEASLSDAHGYIEKPIRTAQLFEVVLRFVASPVRSRTPSMRPESNL